ncbi:hypothetical protein [Streptomyces sp. NPDC002547]
MSRDLRPSALPPAPQEPPSAVPAIAEARHTAASALATGAIQRLGARLMDWTLNLIASLL